MKKRLLTLILTGVMVLSLAACGGKEDKEASTSGKEGTESVESTTDTSENTISDDSATSTESKEEKTEVVETDKSDASSVKVYYGWGSGDEEKYTSEIFCPEGAVFDEKTLQIYKEDGSVMTVQVDDEVNEYMATSTMHWHRDAYNSEPTVYPIIAQLYFDGELDAETAEENSNCSQEVTPLGFKWNGYDVILIETKYTFKDYGEQTELFAGVEYDLDYWKTEEGTGEVKDLTTKALFGFDMYSYGWDELTQDQCAWIIGELLGVDSGIANPFTVSDEETTAPAVNVEADELLGTWLERDSDWGNTYIFNADGTGMLISGLEYPFTYAVSGEVLTLTYDVDDEEEFTISVSGDLLTMVDQFGYELLLDKEAVQNEEPEESEEPEEAEPENPYVKEIVATWVDEESGYQETFTFNADGTGMYSCVDGEYYEYPITYNFLRNDYLQFFYEDGSEGGFIIRIEGDTLYVTNDYVVDMPLVRQ
ncbi:MAG: hypothetical protein J6L65_07095 [Lachnospiraceae bacterium]|nr:hypothetical protein [Lachnospiraceae bacterium]